MNIYYRTLFVFLILALAIVPSFSQDANTTLKKIDKKTQREETKDESRSDGLMKIKSHSSHDRDFDIPIDEEALEANMERAVEKAMKSVELAMEQLDKLDIRMESIKINIPTLNVEIDPIEIDLDDLDIDMDHRHFR